MTITRTQPGDGRYFLIHHALFLCIFWKWPTDNVVMLVIAGSLLSPMDMLSFCRTMIPQILSAHKKHIGFPRRRRCVSLTIYYWSKRVRMLRPKRSACKIASISTSGAVALGTAAMCFVVNAF